MDEVETVFQYYTIVDPILTPELVEDDSRCFQDENSCDSKPEIMYLLQEDIGENSLDIKSENELTESADTQDTNMVAPFKVITLQNGQVLMTETSSLDEIQIHGDDTNEGFREVELEDGSRAFIENKLWTSFTTEDARTDDNASDETLLEIKTKLVKKFPCLYAGCEKVYSSLQHLTVHVRSHTGSKPYHCTFVDCRKAFATGYSLKSHQRSHSEEKPYGCLICAKHFKTSGDLQKHVRTHTGERPFVCPVTGCGRRFTTSNIRKVHVRSHTGERPYTCEYPACGKAFASATNFKNHVRIHTGEKPYMCGVEGCNKRFTEYSSLHKHNSVHSNNKPFKCNICGQLCKLESSIRNHKRIVHNILLTSDGTEIFVEDLHGALLDGNVATSNDDIAEELVSREDEFIIP